MKRSLVLLLVLCLILVSVPTMAETSEPTVVTMFYKTTRNTNEFTELTHQYVIDTLGIDMQVSPGSSKEWQQQLALLVTSGEVPDVVAFLDNPTWLEYAQEGIWYDLTDTINEYPNIDKYVERQTADPDTVWKRLTVDGKLYGIPYMAGAPCKQLNILRKDWLDKLGYEVPTTLDELTEILRAFTFDDPDGNGVDDTYGFAGEGLDKLTDLFGAFGATPKDETYLRDGKMYTNVISDECKNALEYIRDIYAEGLIYPEMFTVDATQFVEEWVRGTFGVCTVGWTWPGNSIMRYGFLDQNPDGDIEFFNATVGPDGWSGHYGEDDISSIVAISAKCEHVDKVMELLDWHSTFEGYSIMMYGIEGQFWTGDKENEEFTWCYTIEGKDSFGNPINDMQFYKILGDNPLQNKVTQLNARLDVNKSTIVRSKQTEYIWTTATYNNAFVGLTSDEYIALRSETEKYYKNYFISFITGEKSIDEEWDSYVAGYLDCGGEAIRQSLLDVYNNSYGTAYTFGN